MSEEGVVTETPSEPPSPVCALLLARCAELLGGEDSIGVQEQRVAQLQGELDAAVAHLAECQAEVDEIDRALSLLAPVPTPVEPEPEGGV